MRIIFVDDEVQVLRPLTRMLELAGGERELAKQAVQSAVKPMHPSYANEENNKQSDERRRMGEYPTEEYGREKFYSWREAVANGGMSYEVQ